MKTVLMLYQNIYIQNTKSSTN